MPISETIEIIYPAWFTPAFNTKKRYIDIWGGRSRGGSHTGTNYFLDLITYPSYFRGYFIRQSFNDIRASLFQDFKDRIAENPTVDLNDFRINETSMAITYVPTGNMIISKGFKKTGTQTAKMKSLAGATHVLIEECDEVGEDEFLQMDLSLRTTKVENLQILRIFNPPPKQHWIWNDYILTESVVKGYFKATPKTDSSVLSLFSTYKSNLANTAATTIEKFLNFKLKKPDYYYTVICGLISEGQKGRIFNNWQSCTDEEFNAIDSPIRLGLDFGLNTGGLVAVKFVREKAYIRELYYGGATAKQLGILFCTLGITNEMIIADCADPMKINKLRSGWKATELLPGEAEQYPQLVKGFRVHAVYKPKGCIVDGISIMQEHEIFVTENSPNVWREYTNYRWALDLNKNPIDEPVGGNEQTIDPARYCFMSKGRLF